MLVMKMINKKLTISLVAIGSLISGFFNETNREPIFLHILPTIFITPLAQAQ